MKIKYMLLATISGGIIALDQLTKLYIHTRFHLHESKQVIPGFFDITYVRNFGAAFGIFTTMPANLREMFFLIIPVVAMVVIVTILRTTKDAEKIQILALSLIFGGAVGNYIDRLRFKYVIDFLDFHWRDVYHWPAFNVADSAIVCGVGVLLLQTLLVKERKHERSRA
jgi:signal peptidase II